MKIISLLLMLLTLHGNMAYAANSHEDFVLKCLQLSKFDSTELRILRNSIYAAHGYLFKSQDLQKYFEGQSWYKPNPKFAIDNISEGEKLCISKIENQEKYLKFKGKPTTVPWPIIERLKHSTEGMGEYPAELVNTSTIAFETLKSSFDREKFPSIWKTENESAFKFVSQTHNSTGAIRVDLSSGSAALHIPLSSGPLTIVELEMNFSPKPGAHAKNPTTLFPSIFSVGLFNPDIPCAPYRSYVQDCSYGGVQVDEALVVWNIFFGIGRKIPANSWNKITILSDLTTRMMVLSLNGGIIHLPHPISRDGEYTELQLKFESPVDIRISNIAARHISTEGIFDKFRLPSGKTVHAPKGKGFSSLSRDINGDGKTEVIELVGSVKPESFMVVNNITELYTGWADVDLVDLDPHDFEREIAISDDGPSDDYSTTFFRFDGTNLVNIGTVGGVLRSGLNILGTGELIARERGGILQTWFYDKRYRLTKDHKLEPIDEDLYLMGTRVKVLKPLSLQKSRVNPEVANILTPGETVTILASDNKKWCLVRNDTGMEGWFQIERYSNIHGTGEEAATFFDGLSYAD